MPKKYPENTGVITNQTKLCFDSGMDITSLCSSDISLPSTRSQIQSIAEFEKELLSLPQSVVWL